jgi:hypothetical protein
MTSDTVSQARYQKRSALFRQFVAQGRIARARRALALLFALRPTVTF